MLFMIWLRFTFSLPRSWIDKEHGLEQILWPDRDGDGKGDVGAVGDMVKYRISTYTGDERWALVQAAPV